MQSILHSLQDPAIFGGALFPVVVGLGSSFTHCAGMCGPIHFFLATQGGAGRMIWLYHAGRIIGYSLIGAILGAIGHVFTVFSTVGFRVSTGILLAILYSLFGMGLLGWLPKTLDPEKKLSFLFPAKTFGSLAGLGKNKLLLFPGGMLASFLPCPSTHAVMLWSLGLDHIWKAAGSMAMLGIATLPVFAVLPSGLFNRTPGTGRLYRRLLGMVFLGLSAWRIYGIATRGTASCH